MKISTKLRRVWAKIWPFVTARNLSIVLSIATTIGVLAPAKATMIRNVVGGALGIITGSPTDLV